MLVSSHRASEVSNPRISEGHAECGAYSSQNAADSSSIRFVTATEYLNKLNATLIEANYKCA
jgi:hypothetical protein